MRYGTSSRRVMSGFPADRTDGGVPDPSAAGYFGGGAPTTASIAWASSRCPAGEGWMLQVPSGSLISSPAAHGEPPKAIDGPWKAAKPSATFPPKAVVTPAITALSSLI